MTRVAFFPDSLHETNGVARTSRALVAAAAARGVPLLCVNGAAATRWHTNGTHWQLELARGPASFRLERDLRHDMLLWRHLRRVIEAVRAFQPDLVHVTGPSDVGQLGAYVAHVLRLPLVASWHTNLHEYAAQRAQQRLRWLPRAGRQAVSRLIERGTLAAVLRFYRMAAVLLAPNLELVELLRERTAKPTYLMRRGVDATLFSPAKRDASDGVFRFGYTGRLSAEKNVRLLPRIERALLDAGRTQFRFVIVGDGQERKWLEEHLQRADFTGVLHDEALARTYANMDLFVFPSETDTFGNVVQEALASGTPALVSNAGGPKFIVRRGISGFVASTDQEFIDCAQEAIADRRLHGRMRLAARRQALGASWNNVFDEVLDAYAAATGRDCAREANAS